MAKLIDITGKSLSGEWGTDDETGDGIPVLRTTNFTNEGVVNYNDVVTRTITKKNIADKFLRKGDIIIEKSGGSDKFPVGRVIYFDGEEKTYLFNNFTGLLRVKNQDDWYPKYIFYSLYANYKRGGTRAFENKTTGLHNLKTDDYVSRYEVAEIDKTEQILICEKLNKLYEIIKLRRQELQLLDELIKARFVEMFGDPVYNTNDLPIRNLNELGNWASGGTPSRTVPEYFKGNIDWYSAGELNTLFLEGSVEKITEEAIEKSATKLFKAGSLLIGMYDTAAFKMGILKEDSASNQACACITPNDEVNIIWLYYELQMMKEHFLSQRRGVRQKNLNLGMIKAFKIPIAKREQQDEFSDFVKQVDKSKVTKQIDSHIS